MPNPLAHPRRILITAGPTYEPIDAVRFIGNRSSGKMGIALADAAASGGASVTLLLGPVPVAPSNPGIALRRFRSCADLESLLAQEAPAADILIMAAAVADYRPKPNPAFVNGKFRRGTGPVMLELEPTPDLLAQVSRSRRPDQLFVGFALEPMAELLASAQAKLIRKRVDMVIANPLETMDSDLVRAMILFADGSRIDTPGEMTKSAFAPWLLAIIHERTEMLVGKPSF